MLSKTLLTCAAAVVLTYSHGAMAGTCVYLMGEHVPTDINFGKNLTLGLTIPQDAPNGTIIYEETSTLASRVKVTCNGGGMYGFSINKTLGNVTSGSVFPLGVPGLSFRIFDDSYLYAPSPQPGDFTMTFPSTTYRLEIIKSGELSSQSSIPPVYLGEFGLGGTPAARFKLINPITVNAASCQTPSVMVAMGDDYELSEFEKIGDTSPAIKFNIALNNCNRGIQKVTYELKANTPIIDVQKGVVALDTGSSAKGIGLQLKNEAGQPISFGTPYQFSGFNSTGTNFNIPLSASYIRLADGILEPGTANTNISFIMSYL